MTSLSEAVLDGEESLRTLVETDGHIGRGLRRQPTAQPRAKRSAPTRKPGRGAAAGDVEVPESVSVSSSAAVPEVVSETTETVATAETAETAKTTGNSRGSINNQDSNGC